MEQEYQEHEEPEAVEGVDALPVAEDEGSQQELSTEDRARAQGWRPRMNTTAILIDGLMPKPS